MTAIQPLSQSEVKIFYTAATKAAKSENREVIEPTVVRDGDSAISFMFTLCFQVSPEREIHVPIRLTKTASLIDSSSGVLGYDKYSFKYYNGDPPAPSGHGSHIKTESYVDNFELYIGFTPTKVRNIFAKFFSSVVECYKTSHTKRRAYSRERSMISPKAQTSERARGNWLITHGEKHRLSRFLQDQRR